jgi:Zn-dependent metalloprotease
MLQKERVIIIVLLTILITTFSNAVAGQAPIKSTSEARALELKGLLSSLEGVPHEPPRVFRTGEGYLRFIGAPPLTHFQVAVEERGKAEEAAGAFLNQWRTLFVNESPSINFQTIRVKTQNGRTYLRYKQMYAGLDVFGAEMIVQINAAGGIDAVISDIMRDTGALDTEKISLKPAIDALTAQKKGIEFLAEQHQKLKFIASEPVLMIYAPEVVGNKGEVRLVWQMEVSNVGLIAVKELVLVDAHSGEIALHYPLIHSIRWRQILDEDQNRDLVREEGQLPCGIPDADNAYDYLGATYDFYYIHHGRDSIDNSGMTLIGVVKVGDQWCDAEWASGEMRFGDGLTFDDVVGHEFTHGVTQNTSNLNYLNESGAINESFSDMWGEWIDQNYTNGNDNDAPEVKWILMEDITCTDRRRNMADPPRCSTPYGGPMPDRYGSPYFYTGSEDWGGVHHNCGVGNKLCYLLTDGDIFNGYTITEMGIPKTADLFYECQTSPLLLPASDYYDLGCVLTQAAINLHFSDPDRENVEKACRAVEIAPNLMAWWKLDEGSGVITCDSSDYGRPCLHLTNNPTWVPGRTGRSGDYALEFNGSNWVYGDPLAALMGGQVTLWAWVKPANNLEANRLYSVVTQAYELEEHWYGYRLGLYGYKPVFYIDDTPVMSGSPIDADRWHHIAATYDGSQLKIYVDGSLAESTEAGSLTGDQCSVYIGSSAGGYPFKGKIDNLKVYNYAYDLEQDCFPICHPDYDEWVLMGRPNCWCYPRQCYGDADNAYETTKTGNYYVHFNDLNLLLANWDVKGTTMPVPGICADFTHDTEITKTGTYRVHFNDLNILLANWNVAEPPGGPGMPTDCLNCQRVLAEQQIEKVEPLKTEQLIKWLEQLWLDEEAQKLIDEDIWLKFIESLKEEL